MQDFKNLKVWNESRELVKVVYVLARKFPQSEQFNLTSQICRAAISVTANIAEGAGQDSSSQFRRFLGIAYGSASEILALSQAAVDLEYISHEERIGVDVCTSDVQRMLRALMEKVSGD